MSRRPHESRTLSRSRTQVHPHPHASEIAPRAAADLYSLLCDAMVAADTKAIDALLTDYCVLTHMTGYPQPKVEWLGDIANGAMRYHSHEVVSVQPDTIAGFPVVRGRTRTTATLWGGRGTGTSRSSDTSCPTPTPTPSATPPASASAAWTPPPGEAPTPGRLPSAPVSRPGRFVSGSGRGPACPGGAGRTDGPATAVAVLGLPR